MENNHHSQERAVGKSSQTNTSLELGKSHRSKNPETSPDTHICNQYGKSVLIQDNMKTPIKEKFWTKEETRKLSNEFYNLGKKEALEDVIKLIESRRPMIAPEGEEIQGAINKELYNLITEIKKKLEDLK